jgi:PPOX class probable F420-dependent enzyme
MVTLAEAAAIGARERFLAVISTSRSDGSIQSSVVNAGVLPHPLTGQEVAAFITYGRAKLAHLRTRPQVTITFRAGWEWAAIEGLATIAGPDDPLGGIDADRLRLLRREIFIAAGGTHDDWDTYDEVMAAERRAAVLVTPTRIYSNS